MKKYLNILALLSLMSASLHADEIQSVASGDWQISLAAGYGVLENPRAKTDDVSTWAVPSWYYYGDKFYVENFTLGYSLFESDWLTVDLQGQLNEDGLFFELDGISKLFISDIIGYTPIKDTLRPGKVAEPEKPIERKISYLGGVSATWYTPAVDVTSALMYDVTGVHNGYEWQLNFKKAHRWHWGATGVEIGGAYKSKQLIAYYYDSTLAERGFRYNPYKADATSNWYFKGVVNAPITDSLTFIATLKLTLLGSKIRESYLIDKDSYWSGFIGISYGF